jgi:hypothetical protein
VTPEADLIAYRSSTVGFDREPEPRVRGWRSIAAEQRLQRPDLISNLELFSGAVIAR